METNHRDDAHQGHIFSRAYRAAGRESPPEALDARILSAARAAVQSASHRRANRWAVPVSVAATLVLTVGIVLRLHDRGALEPEQGLHAPAEAPVASAPVAPAPEITRKREAPLLAERIAEASSSDLYKDDERKSEPATAAEEAVPKLAQRSAAAGRAQAPPSLGAAAVLSKEKKAMSDRADVILVQVAGKPGAYEFVVGIRSPDTGCQQYADWWEVLSEDGKLLYRRVLLHSHVDEQPFTRSGGPVPIQPDTTVWVRAHLSTTGYGGSAFKGSPKTGFAKAELLPTFASELAKQPPLPDGCAF